MKPKLLFIFNLLLQWVQHNAALSTQLKFVKQHVGESSNEQMDRVTMQENKSTTYQLSNNKQCQWFNQQKKSIELISALKKSWSQNYKDTKCCYDWTWPRTKHPFNSPLHLPVELLCFWWVTFLYQSRPGAGLVWQ